MRIKRMSEKIHNNAIDKGLWREDSLSYTSIDVKIDDLIAEGMEAYVLYKDKKHKRDKKHKELRERLADIAISLFDITEGLNINIEDEIVKRHKYRTTNIHNDRSKKY